MIPRKSEFCPSIFLKRAELIYILYQYLGEEEWRNSKEVNFFQLVSAVFKYLNSNLSLLVFFQGNLHTNRFSLHSFSENFKIYGTGYIISCVFPSAANMVN